MVRNIIIFLAVLAGFILVYNYFPEKKLTTEVDKIVVEKSKRRMSVFANDVLLKTYRISLGDAPEGHKHFEGDEKTPEGIYTINSKNPNSGYHLNLGISYPNAADKSYAKAHGKSTGGDIKIHALKNGWGFIAKLHLLDDWTNGCIAVTNSEMHELYHYVPVGTPIEIKP